MACDILSTLVSFFQLEETFGILVTGGLDAEGNVLDTAEFLDLKVRRF